MVVPSPYLPVSPLMVFIAMTVVGARPPKLKLQSLMCQELELLCFSNNTLMAVFTMAISSSRRRACLKENTYSCYKKRCGDEFKPFRIWATWVVPAVYKLQTKYKKCSLRSHIPSSSIFRCLPYLALWDAAKLTSQSEHVVFWSREQQFWSKMGELLRPIKSLVHFFLLARLLELSLKMINLFWNKHSFFAKKCFIFT